MIKQLIAAAALAGVAAVSHAAEPVSTTVANPWYAGVDMGATKTDLNGGTRGSYGGFVGYTFAPNFAVEAGFRRLYTWDGWGGHEHGNQASLSVIGTIPVTQSLGLYGRLGVNQVASHGSWTGDFGGGTNQTFSYSDRTTHALGGIGLSYKLSDQITARVEAQHVAHEVKNYSAGISYAF